MNFNVTTAVLHGRMPPSQRCNISKGNGETKGQQQLKVRSTGRQKGEHPNMMAGSKVRFNEVAVIESKVARNKKAESKKTKNKNPTRSRQNERRTKTK